MRSVKRVADRLKNCSPESRRVFISLGYAIPTAETKKEIDVVFKVMCGEGLLEDVVKFLPDNDHVKAYVKVHIPDQWSICNHWSEWWRRPRHLSKYYI